MIWMNHIDRGMRLNFWHKVLRQRNVFIKNWNRRQSWIISLHFWKLLNNWCDWLRGNRSELSYFFKSSFDWSFNFIFWRVSLFVNLNSILWFFMMFSSTFMLWSISISIWGRWRFSSFIGSIFSASLIWISSMSVRTVSFSVSSFSTLWRAIVSSSMLSFRRSRISSMLVMSSF